MTNRPPNEMRVLLLAPTAKDAAASQALLEGSGLICCSCRSVTEVCTQLAHGAGAIIVPEEAILGGRGKDLSQSLTEQPPWSSLPVLVLTAAGPDFSVKVRVILELGNVTLLKRPLEVTIFVNAVKAALRDRERQYQVRDHLAERQAIEEILRDADRKKDDFIALLAHELRNPLAPIRNGLQVIRLSPDRATRERFQEMMDRQLGHMVRLIDALLDLSPI